MLGTKNSDRGRHMASVASASWFAGDLVSKAERTPSGYLSTVMYPERKRASNYTSQKSARI